MTRSDRTPDQPVEPPPLDPSRVRFEYRNGSMLAIDTVTGGLADSATAMIALMRRQP